MTPDQNRRQHALVAARELVDALERDAPIASCLMKAQRLARLLRDTAARTWLNYETNGYPPNQSDLSDLGHCAKYAYRFYATGALYTPSLPRLEAEYRARESALSAMQSGSIAAPISNFLVAGATEQVLNAIEAKNQVTREGFAVAASTYSRYRGAIYSYAVDTLVSLELGQVAESLFEAARARVDEFVSTCVPRGAEQLLAAAEGLRDGTTESRAAALTACRRFLLSLADAVYPPRSEPVRDARGKERRVGRDEYKNRLLAFLGSTPRGETENNLLASQIEVLAKKLDALNEMLCKGVHDSVSESEAQLALIETYIFAAEVARRATPKQVLGEAAVLPGPSDREKAARPNAQSSNDEHELKDGQLLRPKDQ